MRKIVVSNIKKTVTYNGRQCVVSQLQFDLLLFLILHKGEALKKSVILSHVWVEESIKNMRILDQQLLRIRKAIGDFDVSKEEWIIKSIPGNLDKEGRILFDENADVTIIDKCLVNIDAVSIDGNTLWGSYFDSNENCFTVIAVAESQFGELIILAGSGRCFAIPIDKFKNSYVKR